MPRLLASITKSTAETDIPRFCQWLDWDEEHGNYIIDAELVMFGTHSGVWVLVFLFRFGSSLPVLLSVSRPLSLSQVVFAFLPPALSQRVVNIGRRSRENCRSDTLLHRHSSGNNGGGGGCRTVYRIWKSRVWAGGSKVCFCSGHLGTVIIERQQGGTFYFYAG